MPAKPVIVVNSSVTLSAYMRPCAAAAFNLYIYRFFLLFQQGKGIFVHTTDTPAMMRQTRHAMSHIRLYPTEGITNMLSNLARSLSHIEE